MHIVEQLIAERATKLMARKHIFERIKPLLYYLLSYNKAVAMADSVRPITGYEAFDLVSRDINPKISTRGLGNLPPSGRCILIANHPTGLADGMAVFKAIKDKRPEHIYLANADALRVMPRGEDIILSPWNGLNPNAVWPKPNKLCWLFARL